MGIPRTLGRYEILDLIGRGGTGALYRARDPRIGRYVAIKQLRPDFDTPELRDRFLREAAAAGGLSHPNIVTIYDVGEDDGVPFIAMEYVRGDTFNDLLGLRPPLPVSRKLQLVEEVCAGLAHAHEAGIVHRDIKPANLIVGQEGIVKILDFGIAKLEASELTMPGAVMGTLNYMSPEQASGAAVDARSDLFSVGAVLYELLSHQQAFPGRTPDEVLPRILTSVPRPIADFFPDVDRRLTQLVEWTLEKDPADRISEAALLERELADIRLNAPSTTRRTVRRQATTDTQAALLTPPPLPDPAGTAAAYAAPAARLPEVEAHLARAERLFEAGDFDAAIEACKQVLLLDDGEERALDQLNRIHAAIDEQQAEAERVQREQEERRRRIAELVDRAQSALKDRRLDEAGQLLDLLEESGGAATQHRELSGRLEQARAAAALDAALGPVLREFEAQLHAGALPAAAALVEEAAGIAPSDARVRGARGRLEQAEAARAAHEAEEARRRDAEASLDEAEARLDNGDLSGAEAIITRATPVLTAQDPRIASLAERLRQAVERRAAAEAAERLRRQVSDLVVSASNRFQAAAGRPGDLAQALKDVDQALALDAAHDDARRLKGEIEQAIAAAREAARAAAVVKNAQARFANGKHQAAIKLLEDFQPASRPDVTAALAELRAALHAIEEERRLEQERLEKRARADAQLVQARAALAESRFDAALELVASAREVDPATPDLDALAERVQRAQAAARISAEIDQFAADVAARLAEGDLAAAQDRLAAATALAPSDSRVQRARAGVDQAIAEREAAAARARELETRLAEAAQFLERGDAQAALRSAKAAQALGADDPRNAPLVARIEEAIAQQAAVEAAERGRRKADELVQQAGADLESGATAGGAAQRALQRVSEALALVPEHEGAVAMKAKAEAALAVERRAAMVRAGVRNARNRFANGKHQAAFQLLEELGPESEPSVAAALAELREAHAEYEARRTAEEALAAKRREAELAAVDVEATRVILLPDVRPGEPAAPAAEPAPPASPRGWRWALIVAAAALILILFAIYRFTHA